MFWYFLSDSSKKLCFRDSSFHLQKTQIVLRVDVLAYFFGPFHKIIICSLFCGYGWGCLDNFIWWL